MAITVVLAAAQVAASYGSHGAPAVLIRGSAVNQDGRSSMTAPNGPAQQEVVRLATAVAGVAPAAIAGLSMHGTGALRW